MGVSRPARTRAGRPARTPRRRRQRSVRVTVSVTLLSTATALVLLSLPTRSPLWLSLASVSALLLSWAALRITWTELMQSRRENAADRAAAAKAYQQLFTVRAAEHAEFTTALTERLAQAHLSQRQLEGLLARHRDRADTAECDLAQLQLRLDQALADRVAAHSTAQATAQVAAQVTAQRDPDVVELATWDGQRAVASAVPLRQA